MAHQPSQETDRALYAEHYAILVSYTDRLREDRCRHTTRFDLHVDETLRAFAPLFTAWKAEILFVLYMHGPSRFTEIKRRLAPISSRVLTDKLQECMHEGWVAHASGAQRGYSLLARGEAIARHLHPLLFYLNGTTNVARLGKVDRHARPLD